MWHVKYARDRPIELLIHINEEKSGSHIWQKALSGHVLVQSHCFWEIDNSGLENFWDELWNQLPKLGMDPRWQTLRDGGNSEGRVKVKDYWEEAPVDGYRG